MATAPALLLVLSGCDRCGDAQFTRKYANVDGERLCRGCWERAGRPYPKRTATEIERFALETAIRERMTARGGTGRHLVRNGKA